MPSSAIADIEYEIDTQRLTVKFTTGRIYQFEDVPPEIGTEFLDAPSKGAFFNSRIRDRYTFVELRSG